MRSRRRGPRTTSTWPSPPGPTVVVLQDLDPKPGFGAFWGEVNTAVHKGLGALGCVTNGSMRDIDDCAPGFQLLAGKIGPSHAHVHIVDFGGQVNVAGMTVCDGDVVHADRHGAVVVPREAGSRRFRRRWTCSPGARRSFSAWRATTDSTSTS